MRAGQGGGAHFIYTRIPLGLAVACKALFPPIFCMCTKVHVEPGHFGAGAHLSADGSPEKSARVSVTDIAFGPYMYGIPAILFKARTIQKICVFSFALYSYSELLTDQAVGFLL